MKIVILSDLHGKIIDAFRLVKRLESERQIKIDFILQCGDAGIFPDLTKLDRATLKHSRSDVSETGFSRYFTGYQAEIDRFLADVNCPMICVRGNHEDHNFLDDLEHKSSNPYFPVDYYQKIFVMKSGEIICLNKNNELIKIMGIGRIGSPDNKKSQRYIQDFERSRLRSLPGNSSFDILISHDSALDFVTHGYGMPEIRDILDRFEPLFHFYGHTGTPFSHRTDDNGFTTSVKIAELRLTDEGTLPQGSMILLHWENYNKNKIEIINDKWFKEYDPISRY